MSAFRAFIKREPVFAISVLAAAISCVFVPPDALYLEYIDFRTLSLLYCLMTVVAGFREANIFTAMSRKMCLWFKNVRSTGIMLVCLCFFSSMIITNDVALLAFVPFTVIVLGMAGRMKDLTFIIALQTVAANLGSMLTPVGNPQNLYLYSYYNMSFFDFISTTFPVWLLSLALLLGFCLLLPRDLLTVPPMKEERPDVRSAWVCVFLMIICMLTVVRILNWYIMLAAVAAVLLIFDRKLLLKADMFLLLTFVAFFVFSGNLARIDAAKKILQSILSGREYFVSLAVCQVISNVPTALLLSGFTKNASALLLGVNIGGLGTPVASLASLIGLKLYSRTEGSDIGKFFLEFTALNVAMLIILSAFQLILR